MERLAIERQQQYYDEMRRRRQEARFGDIVRVTFTKGRFRREWSNEDYYRFEPFSVELLRGETKTVTVQAMTSRHMTRDFEIKLSDDANIVYFDAAAYPRLEPRRRRR